MNSSPFGKIYLFWINIFAYSLIPGLVIWLISGVCVLAGFPLRYFFYALSLFVVFLVYYIGFNALKQPEIFYMAKPLKSRKKYNASILSDRDREVYH